MRFTGGPHLYLSLAMFLGIAIMALSDSRDVRVMIIAPVAVLYTLAMGMNALQASTFTRATAKASPSEQSTPMQQE